MIGRKAVLLAAPAVLCCSLFLGAADAGASTAHTRSGELQATRLIHVSRYVHTARYIRTSRYVSVGSVAPSGTPA
jgi:hypothetical protein